ncbi:MAG TPA: glycosyltransferase family 4 protein [Ktedonobacterales bacterium]|nr:glycosyltransferase family 4 protein [Ktedonobacterales bacterium]
MKIGLVSPYDWSYPGGVQDHILRLASELRGRGHSVRILTPATGARARQVEYGVYKLGWAAPLHVNGSVARIALAPDLSGRLRGILQREQFDVIHLHEPLASALGLSVLHLASSVNATLIGTFHAWARHSLASAPEWAYASAAPFLGRYFRRLRGRIAVSPAAEEFVSRFFPGDYRLIPNGVDTALFRPDAAPLSQFNDGKLNILYLGRIEKRKGLKHLLRAIPLIREHYPHTRFLIGGDGPLRAAYEKLVAEAGWPDVVFLGRVPTETMPALYTTADVFCAPGTGGESQGIVLLEALASGRAVVASDIPGYRSVIQHQRNGLLVQPGRHEELAWAICHLLGSETERQRLGEAGHRRAETFSWERVATQVLAYYEEVRGGALSESIYLAAQGAPISLAE